MKMSRAGVRVLTAGVLVAVALLVSGRAVRADCGRSAANEARPVYREVESHPPTTVADARASRARVSQYVVLPCPDDPPAARAADYQVFIAWRRALDARARYVEYGAAADPRCAPVRRALLYGALVEAYQGAFTRVYEPITRASPDALHVADLLRREGRAVGLALPAPWTVRNVARPVSMEPFTVRAHLPRGLVCPV
jgi:hypothetical protein